MRVRLTTSISTSLNYRVYSLLGKEQNDKVGYSKENHDRMVPDSSMYQLTTPSLAIPSKQDIIEQFFDNPAPQTQETSALDNCYFEYFENQCGLARQNDDPENQICTLQNICKIVSDIKAGVDRDLIKSNLFPKLDNSQRYSDDHLNNAIDLAVRLYLMVYTGQVRRGVTGQTPFVWKEGSLKAAITEQFQHQLVLTDTVKFEKVFNARNIERIADVSIQWTPNLVDHLRLNEDSKKPVLSIFHHARFLEFHRESNFFPPGLMDETTRTLALLLPTHDSWTRKWFRSQSRTHKLDSKAISCGQLKLEDRQIDHFKYWHDRLVILKQFFDDSEPRTVKQWWFDDRKRVQWFWVAIVLIVCTVLFGLVQCIEGGWQIWKAYYPST